MKQSGHHNPLIKESCITSPGFAKSAIRRGTDELATGASIFAKGCKVTSLGATVVVLLDSPLIPMWTTLEGGGGGGG